MQRPVPELIVAHVKPRRGAIRAGGTWEPHAHEEPQFNPAGETEGVLRFDPHVWLDPENAKAMAKAVALDLAKADPEKRDLLLGNLRKALND